jgi:hypothetical protein
MAGDARLGLSENFGKIGDGDIAGGQQRQKTQARRLTGRLQNVHQRIQT